MGVLNLDLHNDVVDYPIVAYECLLVAPPEVVAVAYATGLHFTGVATEIPVCPSSSGIVVCLPRFTTIPHLPPHWTGVWARSGPLPAGAWIPLAEAALSDVQAFGAALKAANAWRCERCRLAASIETWSKKAESAKELAMALTAEHDLTTLLTLILLRAREFVPADASSLYLVKQNPDGQMYLHLALAQNDSVQGDWQKHDLALEPSSIAGAVARLNDVVNISDVYNLSATYPFRHNDSFDSRLGYRTRSLLGIPLAKRNGEMLGVFQLINRKPLAGVPLEEPDHASEAMPFSTADVDVLRAFASLATVCLEKNVLYQENEGLLQAVLQPRWLQ